MTHDTNARGMEARSGETEGLDPAGATARSATPTRPERMAAAAQGEALTYTLDDFFAEAKAKNLTVHDLLPGLLSNLAAKGDPDALAALAQGEAPPPSPIDMVLHCPACGKQHIDAPEPNQSWGSLKWSTSGAWENPPHRSHKCHGCGHIWRPADVPTNGVAAVKTKGKADSAPPPEQAQPAVPALTDALDRIELLCTRVPMMQSAAEYGQAFGLILGEVGKARVAVGDAPKGLP